MTLPHRMTARELADAVAALQQEHREITELLRDVDGSVLDRTPDGLSVAYLSARTLADIRRHVNN